MSRPYDALVTGGGIHGASLALFLARAGMDVALYEKGSVCRAASGVNGGTLSLQTTRAALVPHALKGRQMWRAARDWLGEDVGLTVRSGLSLAFTEDEEALLVERARLQRAAGAAVEVVPAARARAIEPGLSDGVLAAAHYPDEGFTAAYLTGRAFRAALLAAGVHLFEHTPVAGAEPAREGYRLRLAGGAFATGRRLVLAAGVWTEAMLAWLGVRLPLAARVDQLAVTERTGPLVRTVLGVASGLLTLVQHGDGTVVIGGGWQGLGDRERGGHTVHPDRLVGNLRLACHAVPALRGARLARAWAGLEAETADGLPAVGELPGHPEAFVCAAVPSGYASGPYVARLLADRILGREPERPLFPPGRLVVPDEPPPAEGGDAVSARAGR